MSHVDTINNRRSKLGEWVRLMKGSQQAEMLDEILEWCSLKKKDALMVHGWARSVAVDN